MINGNKVLAIIPARGGSKGVRRKNIRLLASKPLIAWTIDEAKKSQYIDRLVLSTEDDEIIRVARECNCETLIRPAQLAKDDTPGIEVVLHAIESLPGYAYTVLLQPTSPLRTVSDIDGCIEYMIQNDSSSCVSVCEPSKSPFWSYQMDDSHQLIPLINGDLISNRQQLPPVFVLNGAVYVAKTEWLANQRSFLSEITTGYEMTQNNSLDIDSEMDLEICEYFLNKNLGI